MIRFNVTYEIVTKKSARHGDVAERGFICKDVDLRTAIDAVRDTRTSACGGVECIEPSSSDSDFDWITIVNGVEFATGAQESRAIHFPDNVTLASRQRIARLLEQ